MSESIPLSVFPHFLDHESIYFIFFICEKELELENYQKIIEKARKEVQSRRSESSISSAKELYKNVVRRIRDISKSVLGRPLDSKNNVSIYSSMFDEITENNSFSEIVSIRSKISEISKTIKEFIDFEVKRVTELYEHNPGEAKVYGLYHLIRCLVGEKVREFNKYTRKKYSKNSFN